MIAYRPAEARDVTTLRSMLQALADHDGGDYAVGSEAGLLQHGFGPRPLFWAMLAERETSDRLLAGFLSEKIGATFEGRISGVTRSGLSSCAPSSQRRVMP